MSKHNLRGSTAVPGAEVERTKTYLQRLEELRSVMIHAAPEAVIVERQEVLKTIVVAEEAHEEPSTRSSKNIVALQKKAKKLTLSAKKASSRGAVFNYPNPARERVIRGSHIVRRADELMKQNPKLRRRHALTMAAAECNATPFDPDRGCEKLFETPNDKRGIRQSRRTRRAMQDVLVSPRRSFLVFGNLSALDL